MLTLKFALKTRVSLNYKKSSCRRKENCAYLEVDLWTIKKNEQIIKILRESLFILLKKFTKSKLSINSFLYVLKVLNEMKHFKYVNNEDCIIIQEIASVFIPTEYMSRILYIQNYSKACKYLETTDSFRKSITTDKSTKDVIAEVREFMINFYNTKNV